MTNETGSRLIGLHDLIASGRLVGYLPGPPPTITAECLGWDREAAAESVCLACGLSGCEYLAFHSADPRLYSYLAFARCPCCGHHTEL